MKKPDRQWRLASICVASSDGLLIDTIGEVLRLNDAECEANPVNLDSGIAQVSAGIHRLENQLMVVLDVDRVLDRESESVAA